LARSNGSPDKTIRARSLAGSILIPGLVVNGNAGILIRPSSYRRFRAGAGPERRLDAEIAVQDLGLRLDLLCGSFVNDVSVVDDVDAPF
jgi:hypothetical protein